MSDEITFFEKSEYLAYHSYKDVVNTFERGIDNLKSCIKLLGDEKLLKKVLYMANIMGAFATTKNGAISSILTLDELINYIKE